ncbi:hypothetical protein VTJ04DRAFT_10339 [Mycothermus thermophilus]|uniref:uncharacterized protein n=1 Tax=Humicola insolens TaxID=85995 RepID=UPI003743F056
MSSSFRARFEYFLDLPVEIRVKIYDLVLCSPRGVAPEYVRSDEREKVDLCLLRVNKLVALEATTQFYSFNTFHFHSTARMILDRNRWRRKSEAREWCKKIGRNAHLVQHIGLSPTPALADSVNQPAEFKYFLDLPTEICIEIYNHALPTGFMIAVWCTKYVRHKVRPYIGLLRVRKLVAAEAADHFYSRNVFTAWAGRHASEPGTWREVVMRDIAGLRPLVPSLNRLSITYCDDFDRTGATGPTTSRQLLVPHVLQSLFISVNRRIKVAMTEDTVKLGRGQTEPPSILAGSKTFLHLPVELRFQIYSYALPSQLEIAPMFKGNVRRTASPYIGLLRTSKLIAAETTSQFYCNNATARGNLIEQTGLARWLRSIGRNASFIHTIHLDITIMYDGLDRRVADITRIPQLVPNLNRLYVTYWDNPDEEYWQYLDAKDAILRAINSTYANIHVREVLNY